MCNLDFTSHRSNQLGCIAEQERRDQSSTPATCRTTLTRVKVPPMAASFVIGIVDARSPATEAWSD
jgi:hypothetical protein